MSELIEAWHVLVGLGGVVAWLVRVGQHEQRQLSRLDTIEKRLDRGDRRFDSLIHKIDHVSGQLSELQGYIKGRDDREDK